MSLQDDYAKLQTNLEGLVRDAKRYRWIREHGAWETEEFLNGLTAEQYDKALDERMLTG